MRRLIKRIACAALLCALFCTAVFAETTEGTPSAPVEEVKTESPSEPAGEPQPPSESAEKSGTEEETEPTATPEAEPTETPAPEQTEAPSSERTGEPASTEEPTPEPSETPELTPEPSPEPESALRITVTDSVQAEDGRFVLKYKTPQDIVAISWDAAEGAALYRVGIAVESGIIFQTETEGTQLLLAVSDFLSGSSAESTDAARIFSLTVEALGEERETLAQGSLRLELASEGGFRPGRGGFHGGGFGGRGMGGAAEEEQGFHVTPGKALTSTHSTGDKSMDLYGGAEITLTDEPVCALSVGGVDITLDGSSFTAMLDADTLTLVPISEGEAWLFSGKALKTLNRSGIHTLILRLGSESIEIPTALEMRSAVYAKLAARGIASKDYNFTVSADGTEVSVSGKCYHLNADWELTEIGG